MTEVIVLKEGTHGAVASGIAGVVDSVYPICSAVVLIKGERNVIVDPGNFGYEDEILGQLDRNRLQPQDIGYVINTHEHYDHISNNYLFRHAQIIAFGCIWHGQRVDEYANLDRIQIPGIRLIDAPGHTPSHIAVVVEGKPTYVIAGDAIRHDMLEKGCVNSRERESARKILGIADVVIPGHGPLIQGERLEEFRRKLG